MVGCNIVDLSASSFVNEYFYSAFYILCLADQTARVTVLVSPDLSNTNNLVFSDIKWYLCMSMGY